MQTGKYSDSYLKEAGKDAPKFTDEDLRIIALPVGLHRHQRLHTQDVRDGVGASAGLPRKCR